MKRGYSTKEICEIFNIGRETLRHYENVGLIHPEINPQNGYREYGYWDVGVLVDALKFRKADYSLNQIKKALYERIIWKFWILWRSNVNIMLIN